MVYGVGYEHKHQTTTMSTDEAEARQAYAEAQNKCSAIGNAYKEARKAVEDAVERSYVVRLEARQAVKDARNHVVYVYDLYSEATDNMNEATKRLLAIIEERPRHEQYRP